MRTAAFLLVLTFLCISVKALQAGGADRGKNTGQKIKSVAFQTPTPAISQSVDSSGTIKHVESDDSSFEVMAATPFPAAGPTLSDPCCDSCRPRHCHHCGLWKHVGLPCPHHMRLDIPQHQPYYAFPKSRYYFRPYNYFHIAEHQRDVAEYGRDIRNPYDNRHFEEIYQRFPDPNEPSEPEEIALPPR